VHRDAGEAHGNFGAGEVGQAGGTGRIAGALLAAELVVIGQGPQLDAVGLGPRRQRFGCQRAVGDQRMAVQVGVQGVAA
jgi:hypothetical protein